MRKATGPLANSDWYLTALGNTTARSRPDRQPSDIVFFDADGQVHGNGGCTLPR
ncbi:MAG: hypothetical protein R2932_30810 [Caldilineaceae bacterium]